MIKVQRFINQLLSSNCFIVYDDETMRSLLIDPGSEKSENEIDFIEENHLIVDFIILTHEHTDHNWGVNSIKEKYPDCKLVCSELSEKMIKKTNRVFFTYYYNNPDYIYTIDSVDIVIKDNDEVLKWDEIDIHFIMTPGHSKASLCIDINGLLFTGDTIMPYPRYIHKKDGDEEEWRKSVKLIESKFSKETDIFPGHGDPLKLGEWLANKNLF